MNIYAVSLTIASSLLLTACGGGGGNNTSTNSNTTNTMTTTGSIAEIPTPTKTTTVELPIPVNTNETWNHYESYGYVAIAHEKKSFIINNKNFYSKNISIGEVNNNDLDPIYFSPTAMYQSNDIVDPEYGTQIGKIVAKSDTEISYTPYSKQADANDLIMTKKIKTIDLAGKNILHNIYYEYFNTLTSYSDLELAKNTVGIEMYNWLTAQKESTFPTGSKCFSIVSEASNIPFIRTDKNITAISNFSNDTNNPNSWDAYKNSINYKFMNMYNVTGYFSTDLVDNSSNGIIEYNGSKHFAMLFQAGIFYDANKNIQDLESYLDDFDPETKAKYTKDIQHLKNEQCDYYNDVASTAIEQRYLKF